MRGSHCEPLALNQSHGMACDYITRLSSLADATSVTDGLEWRDWLFLIFLWPHLLLEVTDV
jgi:hypothetical protein